MTTITITISGVPHSVEATPEQVAALDAQRAIYNGRVTERDPEAATFSDGTAFLQAQVEDRLAQAPDEVPTDIMARALANWAGVPVPEAVVPELSAEAKKALLLAEASRKHREVAYNIVTVNGVIVSTTADGRVDLAGAVQIADKVPDRVFDWVCTTGPVQLTASQVVALGVAVGLWVQSVYTVYGAIVAGINAGTITTTAEIDQAAWPSPVVA